MTPINPLALGSQPILRYFTRLTPVVKRPGTMKSAVASSAAEAKALVKMVPGSSSNAV